MKVGDVIDAMEQVAPRRFAESWDKVGLQVGSRGFEVGGVLLCIDLTEAVVDEAVRVGARVVIAYHPLIFEPVTTLDEDTPGRAGGWKVRALCAAVRAGLSVYCPHTALDAVAGGMNDWLAAGLGLDDDASTLRPIVPWADPRGLLKVVVFVPRGDAAGSVRAAMADAGAGHIGNYDHCSFNVDGKGTFRGLDGANPTIGAVGQIERVEEMRIEMVCPGRALSAVLSAARAAHPYEEPAIDVFALDKSVVSQEDARHGAGRLITLAEPVDAATLGVRVAGRLGLSPGVVRVASGPHGESPTIRTVAVCVGAGGSLFEHPAAAGADAFVTGELTHHRVLALTAGGGAGRTSGGAAVVLAGHTHTERPFLPVLAERLRERLPGAVAVRVSEADRCPW